MVEEVLLSNGGKVEEIRTIETPKRNCINTIFVDEKIGLIMSRKLCE